MRQIAFSINDLSCGRFDKAKNSATKRGLAAARFADETQRPSGFNIDRYTVDSFYNPSNRAATNNFVPNRSSSQVEVDLQISDFDQGLAHSDFGSFICKWSKAKGQRPKTKDRSFTIYLRLLRFLINLIGEMTKRIVFGRQLYKWRKLPATNFGNPI